MKKLLSMAFVGMMALGCGGGSKQQQDPNTAANPPPGQTDPNAPAQTGQQQPGQQ